MPLTDPSVIHSWLHAQAADAAREAGCELFEIKLGRAGRRGRLEVFIDRPGGVGIEDCARVSRALSARLEAADPLEQAYVLEVSSPGLTRPLESPGDYRRFRGRLARLVLRAPVAGRDCLRGTIRSADERSVTIEDEALGRPVEVPFAQVASGRLDFDAERAPAAAPGGRA